MVCTLPVVSLAAWFTASTLERLCVAIALSLPACACTSSAELTTASSTRALRSWNSADELLDRGLALLLARLLLELLADELVGLARFTLKTCSARERRPISWPSPWNGTSTSSLPSASSLMRSVSIEIGRLMLRAMAQAIATARDEDGRTDQAEDMMMW